MSGYLQGVPMFNVSIREIVESHLLPLFEDVAAYGKMIFYGHAGIEVNRLSLDSTSRVQKMMSSPRIRSTLEVLEWQFQLLF